MTIEDAAELRLRQRHVVRLEARPANLEGRGEVTICQLVKNAPRMRGLGWSDERQQPNEGALSPRRIARGAGGRPAGRADRPAAPGGPAVTGAAE